MYPSILLIKKLKEVEDKFYELERSLSDPKVIVNLESFSKIVKEHLELSELIDAFRKYQKMVLELEENNKLMDDPDPEIVELARNEVEVINKDLSNLAKKISILLLPKDPLDEKNVYLEIRAGTGGEEAALFVVELLRMYLRFSEKCRWKVEIISQSESSTGGFKEVIILVTGKGAYSQLKYESGVHRVQRVPITESQGRVHTSTVTVAVLPEIDEIDIEIRSEDLRIDFYRSTGAGGQHVNTTDSAVRVTHLPTGVVVTCQDERSQHKNKAKAMKVLTARLLSLKQQEATQKQAAVRKNQVGTGDRSERIRTYNFPQNRVTDHRIKLTLYKLDQVMSGDLTEFISSLISYFQAEFLKNNL